MTDELDHACPHCKKNAAMMYVDESARLVDEKSQRAEAAYQCYACKRFVIGGAVNLGVLSGQDGVPLRWYQVHERPHTIFQALEGREQYWMPIEPVGKAYDDVPTAIASPADEAYRCHSIGAHRAAVMMGRAVIEAVAKHHDITTGQLYSKIQQMGESGVIRKQTVAAAHGIRDVGNDAAHGDFATADVSKSDASDVLILMDVVLHDAFTGDTRLAKLTSRRSEDPALG